MADWIRKFFRHTFLMFALSCHAGANPELPVRSSGPEAAHRPLKPPKERGEESNALQEIVQLTLDLPQLQPFFHEKELLDRSPLVVLDNHKINTSIRLVKFGKPVLFKPRSELRHNSPVFEFEAIDIQADSAQVDFRYSAEGVRGHAKFYLGDNKQWMAEKVVLVES